MPTLKVGLVRILKMPTLKDLVVIVPSYGRPDKATEMALAFTDTAENANTDLLFALDSQDAKLDEYVSLGLNTIISPTRGMVEALNYACEFLVKEVRPFAVGFMGDDHFPRTQGWDQRYLDALWEMSTGFVYGNDLLQGENLPTQVAMTTNIPRRLGFMAWPKFRHLWVDNSWKLLGESIDRIKYLDDVIIEHMHPANGKAELDEHYERVNHQHVVQHDTRQWELFLKRVPTYTSELKELL